MPYPDWRRCASALTTVIEDTIRSEGPGTADNLKYVLRSVLELAYNKCTHAPHTEHMPPIDRAVYSRCRTAIIAARFYESARLAFGCYWNGQAVYEHINGRHVFTSCICSRHEMLDRLVIANDRLLPDSDNPFPWTISTLAADGTFDTSSKRAFYKFRPAIARRLNSSAPPSRQLLPGDWIAFSTNAHDLRAILNALVRRAEYHALAINTIANHHAVAGGCLDDLLLTMPWDRLVHQISTIAGTPKDSTQRILSALCFGTSTTSPDPALQPILAFDKTHVSLPCFTTMFSSVERNFLTLQARIDKDSFDKQSWLFERDMVLAVSRDLQQLDIPFQTHIKTKAGEADVVFASPDGSTFFLAELKWFLPPGDARETLQRIPTVQHGAQQARRKLASLIQSGQAQSILRLPAAPSSYTAMVVTSGFSSATDTPDVACVPRAVFKTLLGMLKGGADLPSLLRSQPWLPAEGEHFRAISQQHTLASVAFEWIQHFMTAKADHLASAWVSKELAS